MKISEINVYPVKSLGGIKMESARIEERGFEFDRRFMLVDENNELLTQREFSKMATVSVEILDTGLQVSANGLGDIRIPFEFDDPERVTVRVWKSFCEALVAGTEINQWFSDVLETDCRLVLMPETTRRQINELFNRGDEIVGFADGYPVLVISENSLAELNSRLIINLPMNRFRPNLVVEGAEAFAEDKWKMIRIGKTFFRSAKPCARCVVTTIDQATGISDIKEPLRTLAEFRRASDVFPETYAEFGLNKTDVLFGQNLVAENFGEEIKIGDKIEVLK